MRTQAPGEEDQGGEARSADNSGLDTETFVYAWVEQTTENVARHVEAEMAKQPMIDFLFRHFGSLIFYASQRLIERKHITGQARPTDEAVIISCSRLFNECFSGYGLLRKGLILPSILLLRGAFETATQAILFMEREDVAQSWLQGRRIQPRKVRKSSFMARANEQVYARLSRLSHPNVEASFYHTAPAEGEDAIGLAYGGWFAPKQAGQIAVQFLFAHLVFLQQFYGHYEDDLRQHGLLWKAETLEALGRADPQFSWSTYLSGLEKALRDLADHYNALPADFIGLGHHLREVIKDRHSPSRAGSREEE